MNSEQSPVPVKSPLMWGMGTLTVTMWEIWRVYHGWSHYPCVFG